MKTVRSSMFALIGICILSDSCLGQPQISREQLNDFIRTKLAPLRSLVFFYEGQARWVNHADLIKDVNQYKREYQGTFLYRNNEAAYYDVYSVNPAIGSAVFRNKGALLRGRVESVRNLLDSKRKLESKDIRRSGGFLMNFDSDESAIDLFLIWNMQGIIANFYHDVRVEGWETINGHSCLKVRVSILFSNQDQDKERSQRLYWIDLERNAQVLKSESLDRGKLAIRYDDIELAEYPVGLGQNVWLPVRCRNQSFNVGNQYFDEPLYERTISIVSDSLKANLDLPDSVFDVRREVAWPIPKDETSLQTSLGSGPLIQQFRNQTEPPRSAAANDPVSVHQQIEANLAEANRQSRELQASSPARASWSWLAVTQIGIGGLGVALLGLVVVQWWRGR